MEYRRLGRAGVKVSALGLGCNQFGSVVDDKTAEKLVHCALDNGVILFDTSNRYNVGVSEEYLGKALKGRRSDAVIATKFGGGGKYHPVGPNEAGLSRYAIMNALENSLRRLQVDHIDLWQIHVPDINTPLEETFRTLDDIVRMGKVRYIGCSNHSLTNISNSIAVTERLGMESFVSAQEQYNLMERGIEYELVPFYKAHGIGVLPYFPLAAGLLTGKYKRGQKEIPEGRFHGRGDYMKKSMGENFLSDKNFDIIEKLEDLAKSYDHTISEMAIAWLLSHDYVSSVIAGVTKIEHIEANLKAAEWKLTPEQFSEIEAVDHYKGLRVL